MNMEFQGIQLYPLLWDNVLYTVELSFSKIPFDLFKEEPNRQ